LLSGLGGYIHKRCSRKGEMEEEPYEKQYVKKRVLER
jgi:hypothetical protein